MPPAQQSAPCVVFTSELRHVVIATQALRQTAPQRVLPRPTVKVWIGGECYQAQLV
ncbi:MAG: hypothetical protein ABI321_00015 [Polyangia bacterium]